MDFDQTRDLVRANWVQIANTLSRLNERRSAVLAASMVRGTTDEAVCRYGTTEPWDSFECPTCRRILPIDICDMDHMNPRANMKANYHAATDRPIGREVSEPTDPVFVFGSGEVWHFGSSGSFYALFTNLRHPRFATTADVGGLSVHRVNYTMSGKGARVAVLADDGRVVTMLDAATLMENDVLNLQPMCPRCNRSKGAR